MISIIFALLSALFAAMTTILCKCGLKDADSDAATALRTTIVLVLSVVVVWVTGEWTQLPDATGMTLLFLILSGCAANADGVHFSRRTAHNGKNCGNVAYRRRNTHDEHP